MRVYCACGIARALGLSSNFQTQGIANSSAPFFAVAPFVRSIVEVAAEDQVKMPNGEVEIGIFPLEHP